MNRRPAHRKSTNKLLLSLDDYAFYYMRHIVDESQHKIGEAIKPIGITPYAWRIIFVLRSFGAKSIKELSEETLIEASVLSRLVRSLEENGFVRRKKDPHDQRYVLIDLTPTGVETYERIIPIVMNQLQSALKGLTRNDVENLNRIIKVMKDNVYRSPFFLLS